MAWSRSIIEMYSFDGKYFAIDSSSSFFSTFGVFKIKEFSFYVK